MKDKLENFVSQHREMFDDEAPSSSLWNRIDHELPVQSRKVRLHPLAFAASLAAVALTGWFVASLTLNRSQLPAGQANQHLAEMSPLSAGSTHDTVFVPVYPQALQNNSIATNTNVPNKDIFNEITQYYTAEIQKRKTKLYSVSSGNENIISQVEEELAMIDTLNARTRRDLGNEMNVSEVMEEMMQNYRQSLDILDMMLEQLNEEYALSKSE